MIGAINKRDARRGILALRDDFRRHRREFNAIEFKIAGDREDVKFPEIAGRVIESAGMLLRQLAYCGIDVGPLDTDGDERTKNAWTWIDFVLAHTTSGDFADRSVEALGQLDEVLASWSELPNPDDDETAV